MSFKLSAMLNSLRYASQYISTTLFMALMALMIGIIFGLLIALIRLYNVRFLANFFRIIITLLKGIPIVLIILASYLILANNFNGWAEQMHWSIRFKDFNPVWIVIMSLSIMATVNLSEVFRGAFASVKKGQFDAAKSIGLTNIQTIRRVILPQTLPVALPMMSNILIALIKASALASMVSVVDIFAAAKITAQQNYRFLEGYVAVALIYWCLSLVISKGSSLIEASLNNKIRGNAS